LRPEIQKKVREEIHSIVDAERWVCEDDMPKFTYFGQVLQESMVSWVEPCRWVAAAQCCSNRSACIR
jgi:hypothetical protein